MGEKKLLQALIQKFGNNVVRSHYNKFNMTETVLSEIFDLVNSVMFFGKLNKIPVKLENKTQTIPGKAKFCHDMITGNTFIVFYKKSSGDNFLKSMNAFCHEMIHYYDFCFGKWSKLSDKYSLTTDLKNREQYIGQYNIHGVYFMSWIREFKRNGIVVEKYYVENVVRERFFKDDEITEDSTSDEKILEKAIYDSIVTDGFKAVSVSKDHIYIVVD